MPTLQTQQPAPETFLPSNGNNVKASSSDSQLAKDREALVIEHMSLVRFVARQIRHQAPQHVDLDELISAGFVGLLDAAIKFDASKQVLFKSYAQFRIRGAILDSLRTLDWSPRELRRRGREIAEAIRHLSVQLGRTPTDQEIAQRMGLGLDEFHLLTGELKGLEVSSLNEERGEDTEVEELDLVAAPDNENPLQLCIESEQRRLVQEAMLELPEKEQIVLKLYYLQQMTMKEIGLTLGVVESRVSQVRSSGVKHLRRLIAQRRGRSQAGATAATSA